MPRGDGTGPVGMGPMTGRGMGYCSGYPVPGFTNAGFGMRRGRGFRRMYYATGLPGWARDGAYSYGFAPYDGTGVISEADEKTALKNQADYLEKQLKEARERLKGFEEAE